MIGYLTVKTDQGSDFIVTAPPKKEKAIKPAFQSIPHTGLKIWNKGLCALSIREPYSRGTRDLSRPVPERKCACQTNSESYSPELPASVGNVSEITVAGLMGVNTVADGERLRSKRGTVRGKILACSSPH